MKLKKSKNKNNKNIKDYDTVSGLNSKTASIYIISISVFLGIVIFAMIPFVSNRLNKPITSSILNVIPNGMILGFFIVDKNFDIYFKSLNQIFVAFLIVCGVHTGAFFQYSNSFNILATPSSILILGRHFNLLLIL